MCEMKKSTGCVSGIGVFSSGNRQSSWIRKEVGTDELLQLVMSGGLIHEFILF